MSLVYANFTRVEKMDIPSKSSSLNVKTPDGLTIQFNQDSTFENFVGQFQAHCSKLLCIIDGRKLHYYDRISSIPVNIKFEGKRRRDTMSEYYFRSNDGNTSYCVFGREAATIFYPNLYIVDGSMPRTTIGVEESRRTAKELRPPIIRPVRREHSSYPNDTPNITIVDGETKLSFPNPNYSVNIKKLL